MIVALCAALGTFASVRALDPHKHLTDYRMQTWQVDSGLPQNTVHAVVQTRDGFIWLATDGGLVRFDGADFRVFDASNTPALQSHVIDGLMEDSDGSLWISTSDGLVRRRDGKFTAYTTADGLPSNAVTGVFQQRDGSLVIATGAGLARASGEKFKPITGTAATGTIPLVLAEDPRGTLWVGGGEQLLRIPGQSLLSLAVASPVGTIEAIANDDDGNIWLGGTHGLRCFAVMSACDAGATLPPTRHVTALHYDADHETYRGLWVGTTAGLIHLVHGKVTETAGGLVGASIQRLFEDRSHTLWVTHSGGLSRISDRHVESLPRQASAGEILSILEDREGNLWFGSESGGLSLMRDQVFNTLMLRQGAAADYVRTVFQDHAGTIWIGTNGGGLSRYAAETVTPFRPAGGLASDVVLALAETGNDLWIGTPDGLTRVHSGKTQRFTATDGLADNFVRSLYADRDGSLWIGTRNGLSHLSGGTFQSYSTQDGLGSDVVGSVLRTRNGDLWVATLGGLSRLSGDRFVNLTERDGLGSNAVTALFEESGGTMWFATNATGLNRWRDGRITRYAGNPALPETIFAILQDQAGNLWLSSQKGIYRTPLAALSAYADKGAGEIPVTVFGTADGMQISEGSGGGHPAAWRMSDGTLWFATPKGVAWVDPQPRAASPPPRTVIEQVSLDDKMADVSDAAAEINVPAGRERITLHYAGLSFLAPQKVRYRYRLEPFDHDWVNAGSGRTAYYTHVPPGHYTFRVMASNADGVWGEAASLDLRVQPKFFQTRWFYGLVAAALLGLAYAAYRLRVRYVTATYQAVMAERGRIAREVHDTLAQGYVGISVQLEITSRLLLDREGSYDAAIGQLNETKELVRSSLAEARSSIWDLRSEGGEADIFPSRLSAAARAKTHHGPALTFRVQGAYRPIGRKTEDEMLRIAQEAISNAVLHANATSIGVTLIYDAANVVLSVADDGNGFREPESSFAGSGHFGLQGMRERAKAMGATLVVDGSSYKGTEVTLTLNVTRETAEESAR